MTNLKRSVTVKYTIKLTNSESSDCASIEVCILCYIFFKFKSKNKTSFKIFQNFESSIENLESIEAEILG
ncbi:hypothetical protein BpHYR1_049095 [Brachionus plicatilis]|uniref:Uncharacterized protein n=1 Tax=Brachionus plicatilis TaxID=10195 RepID=A0A3M7R786_BRAPC|nr:hypothetical protein BpHYR1_049095 [Brachionus plicatilis]